MDEKLKNHLIYLVLPNEILDIIADLQRITFKKEYDLIRQVLALFTPSENDQRIKTPKKSEFIPYIQQ